VFWIRSGGVGAGGVECWVLGRVLVGFVGVILGFAMGRRGSWFTARRHTGQASGEYQASHRDRRPTP